MRPIPFNACAKLLEKRHQSQVLIQGVAIDSRKVEPGDLFFALSGQKVEGHAFIESAVAKGAVGAVVQEGYRGPTFGVPLLYVPDVLECLQGFAKKSLEKRSSKVIAITGSLGKTTVKGFAATLLSSSFHLFASPSSYNSQATVPLSILMADETEDYLILEMGMSEPGNLQKLISIAPPAIALLTTIAVQHASNFSDGLMGIGREKASIFLDKHTALGLLPYDLPYFEEVAATGTCDKKTFSMVHQEADFFLTCTEKGVRIYAKDEQPIEIACALPIKVHYHNLLAAIALARSVGVSWDVICERVRYLKLPPMRFEKIEKQGILFINDAYNANPDSMNAALENLPNPAQGGKRIAVLGDMDALGDYAESGHAHVLQTALKYTDHLLCLGPRWEVICPAQHFKSSKELIQALKQLAQPGDVVLLKGARAHVLDQALLYF